MSEQYPQHQPQQPGRGGPQPPGKRSVGRFVGFGCAGVIGLLLLIAVVAAITDSGGSGDESGGSTDPASAASSPRSEEPTGAGEAGDTGRSEKPKKPEKKVVTFKVWGTAPAGTLGPLDITYGSDSDNRKGTFENGRFEATLPLDDDALYYDVTAQLQGSGDINCSVTVEGHTEKAHASGGYNICSAQANAALLGGWD
ncbi:hypothetical protein J2X68_000259 [Streptomyces sp. 3330]|uniref:hypothetical protein n=1 Tax=Streptomyces sp. 3330 TaxID=2817755 RepID=UPI00286141D2|nr:hypothetical protein [Streptomyces sp. 3330]MDR6973590.1 hypothetical protein [Streptomyces sp. 3330]